MTNGVRKLMMGNFAYYDNAQSARDLTDKELMARMRTGVITAEEMDEIEFRVRGTTETPSGEATDMDVAYAYEDEEGDA